MAIVIGEFDYLCRLCAAKTGILMGLPIFESAEHLRDIDKKIAACLPVQVSIDDQLPKVVCEACAYKLDQMFDFREKCLHTEAMFIEMLKEMKDEDGHIERTLREVEDIPVIRNSIDRIRRNIGNAQSSIDDIHNGDCVPHDDSSDTPIDDMQVMDEMDLAGGEQVVSQEEIGSQEADIEVTGIDCLDGEAVRMVEEHIHEVSNHEIAMHLEGDMTVVGNLTVDGHLDQLGINYVTTISTDSPSQEQIVHYCDNIKYEAVTVKEEYKRLQGRLTAEGPMHPLKNNVSPQDFPSLQQEAKSELEESIITGSDNHVTMDPVHGDGHASTSQITTKETRIMVEYTKRSKATLLENILDNPTPDETGSNWYVCPFCNEAATEPNSFVAHFDQHFCCCNCGLSFTSVELLSLHEQQCDCLKREEVELTDGVPEEEGEEEKEAKNEKVIQKYEKPVMNESSMTEQSSTFENIADDDDSKRQPSVRQKWTPKVCAQCGKQYRTNYKLQEHMRKHTGEKPFQCLLCEKAFRSKIGLAQHTATHTGEFDYNCSTCGKGFQCKSYLIVHQRVHSDLKPYPCSTCGQNFKTKQSLLDHQNRHMGVKPYMCEICGRGFITKGLCKSHQKIHSGKDNRQYPCEVCNKMFVSKSYLNTHLRIHTGDKAFLCEVCGKGFLTRVDLKIHATVHTGEKSFKCEMCEKVFARRAALRCHRRSHTGERPYTCEICNKTFTQFSPMAIHKRLHTGERPYECDSCEKSFVSRSTMMCHRKKHHLPATSKDSLTNCDDTKTIDLGETHDGVKISPD